MANGCWLRSLPWIVDCVAEGVEYPRPPHLFFESVRAATRTLRTRPLSRRPPSSPRPREVSYQQDRPLRETWAASVPGSMKASRWLWESAMISRRSGKGARVLKALAGGRDVTSP